jgi:hypothetical protein
VGDLVRSSPTGGGTVGTDAGGEPHGDDARLGFQLFAVLSGLAALIFFSERGYYPSVVGGILPVPILLPMALGFALAMRPSSVPLFLGFWGSYTLYLLLGFPGNNTNQTLLFFVGLAILVSAGGILIRKRRLALTGPELFLSFAPVLRVCVVVLYFWTIWHKLNFDFLNPEVSCARRLTVGLLDKFGLADDPDAIALPGVLATIVAEAALPIGLLFARTQRATAYFGLVFHWILGCVGFSGFSSTMMLLLTLFLYPTAGRAFSGYQRAVTFNRLALASYVSFLAFAKLVLGSSPAWLGGSLWYFVPLVVFGLYRMNRGQARGGSAPAPVWQVLARPRPALLVPLVSFVNGASPFLGFKTEYSYAMYSNLRTEGGRTNHLVWRTPLAWAPYQTDLVRVLPGSHAELWGKLGGRLVTRYEVTAAVHRLAELGTRGIRLMLEESGRQRQFDAAETVPELNRAPKLFERKLLSFRRIVPAETGKCAH